MATRPLHIYTTIYQLVINPLSATCLRIETSQFIYTANQLTGFYMRATLARNGLSELSTSYVNLDWDFFLVYVLLLKDAS